MTPLLPHDAPPYGCGASQIICARPPEHLTRFNCPPSKNAISVLSGFQPVKYVNIPGKSVCLVTESSEITSIPGLSLPLPETSHRPSGEMEGLDPPAGNMKPISRTTKR